MRSFYRFGKHQDTFVVYEVHILAFEHFKCFRSVGTLLYPDVPYPFVKRLFYTFHCLFLRRNYVNPVDFPWQIINALVAFLPVQLIHVRIHRV